MIDFGETKPRLSLYSLLMKYLRPGDIFTYTFGELLDTKESIVDTAKQELIPFILAAQKRGVIIDVGNGGPVSDIHRQLLLKGWFSSKYY